MLRHADRDGCLVVLSSRPKRGTSGVEASRLQVTRAEIPRLRSQAHSARDDGGVGNSSARDDGEALPSAWCGTNALGPRDPHLLRAGTHPPGCQPGGQRARDRGAAGPERHAGKSTTLKSIVGLTPPRSGTVEFARAAVIGMPTHPGSRGSGSATCQRSGGSSQALGSGEPEGRAACS